MFVKKMDIDLKSKKQVLQFIEKERLTSVMNNTKWNALYDELHKLESLVSFKVTYIDGSTFPDSTSVSPHTNELASIWFNYLAMEFLDIYTQVIHPNKKTQEPDITDHRENVIKVCNNISVKFTETDYGLRVWGYFRLGNQPELFKNT